MKYRAPRPHHAYLQETDHVNWSFVQFCHFELSMDKENRTLFTAAAAIQLWNESLSTILGADLADEIKSHVNTLLNEDLDALTTAGFVCENRTGLSKLVIETSKEATQGLEIMVEHFQRQEKLSSNPKRAIQQKEGFLTSGPKKSKSNHPSTISVSAPSGEGKSLPSNSSGSNSSSTDSTAKKSHWTAATKKPWNSAPFPLYNVTSVGARESLTDEALEEIEEITTLRDIGVLLDHYCSKCRLFDPRDADQNERAYVWQTMNIINTNWVRTSLDSDHCEGWFGAYLHVPLIDIFASILHCELKLCDIKSVGCEITKKCHKNDAVLHHRGLGIDLLLMEAKSHEGLSGMATDLLKLEQGMSANLVMAMRMVDKSKWSMLRSFGLLMSACRVNILEIRFLDGHLVMYKIRTFSIPAFPSKCSEIVDAIQKMVATKHRVENVIAVLQDRGPEPSPLSSQEGQAIV
ncbi:hypothetical protein BGZ93_002368 [Podila epicladia]|nr:hypothetical protein BGZ92_002578 [Podila epicladia]KAG0097623.1 hypothetical protein BGZ93_002368 [Podila epicladia]